MISVGDLEEATNPIGGPVGAVIINVKLKFELNFVGFKILTFLGQLNNVAGF